MCGVVGPARPAGRAQFYPTRCGDVQPGASYAGTEMPGTTVFASRICTPLSGHVAAGPWCPGAATGPPARPGCLVVTTPGAPCSAFSMHRLTVLRGPAARAAPAMYNACVQRGWHSCWRSLLRGAPRPQRAQQLDPSAGLCLASGTGRPQCIAFQVSKQGGHFRGQQVGAAGPWSVQPVICTANLPVLATCCVVYGVAVGGVAVLVRSVAVHQCKGTAHFSCCSLLSNPA
jgi:hypothetical protein